MSRKTINRVLSAAQAGSWISAFLLILNPFTLGKDYRELCAYFGGTYRELCYSFMDQLNSIFVISLAVLVFILIWQHINRKNLE